MLKHYMESPVQVMHKEDEEVHVLVDTSAELNFKIACHAMKWYRSGHNGCEIYEGYLSYGVALDYEDVFFFVIRSLQIKEARYYIPLVWGFFEDWSESCIQNVDWHAEDRFVLLMREIAFTVFTRFDKA